MHCKMLKSLAFVKPNNIINEFEIKKTFARVVQMISTRSNYLFL
jgi:hypothetical protein